MISDHSCPRRALSYLRAQARTYGVERAAYDGFAMAFLTPLSRDSAPLLESLILKALLHRQDTKGLFARVPAPADGEHVLFDSFWVEAGPLGKPEVRRGTRVMEWSWSNWPERF